MKRIYLVKGEERIEIKQDFDFQTAKLLGYTLEEVDNRRELWLVSSTLGVFWNGWDAKCAVKDNGGDLSHYVELREGERIVSREQIEKAWRDVGVTYATSNHILEDFREALGFEVGDS